MPEVEIGVVSDFFSHPVVAGIDLSGALKAGDQVRIHGHTTDLTFTVESMQVERQAVLEAHAGQAIGIKVPDRVRRGDKVYKVTT
ncbi:MAG: translation elongation factor-like protein [Chloroflexi bacterium]|nr:translation elongation factor-like protein [Chloroflexota bacterium]